MAKAKKVIDIVIYVLLGFVFLVCVFVTVSSINQKKNGVPSVFGYSVMTVQTESMQGTINKGDLIVTKLVNEKITDSLKEGDIISFYTVVDGERIIDTHRINDIKEEVGERFFETKGDNVDAIDDGYRSESDIVSVYKFRIAGLGYVVNFLRTTLGFFLCVFTPLAAFVIYEAYRLITTIIYNKRVEMIDNVKDSTSEDVKNAIIQEYLEKQKLEQEQKENEEELDDESNQKRSE